MYYNDFILNELKSKGVTIIGFADLKQIDIKIRKGFNYGIVIAMAVNLFIISRIPWGACGIYIVSCPYTKKYVNRYVRNT